MKKRIISLLFAIILIVSILPISASAAASLSNFANVKTYQAGQFSDVSDQWFAPFVKAAYEIGLIDGTGGKLFSPERNMTLAEAIKVAVCLHSIYNTGSASFEKGVTPWFQPYVDYALTNGIIASSYQDYTVNATRSDMAVIFSQALPDEALTGINKIDYGAIPDVAAGYSYGSAVYKLYRAGILTGSDSIGTFYPNSYITRDAVAAIVARMANASLRKSLTLAATEMSATEIAEKCAPAVFYIELFGKNGNSIGSGSGFFISSSGLAITNYHVVEGVTSAVITTKSGQKYDVSGVYDYNETSDLALIQINGSGFPYLDIGDSVTAVTGGKVFAIGYPLGIDQTVTSGAITNASHTEDGINYIMIDASISSGSSGGALVNASGAVIGVTSAYYSGGQNLNLAVPINLYKELSASKSLIPLSTLFAKNTTYYLNYPTIPDLGACTGLALYNLYYSTEHNAQYYVYTLSSFSGDLDDIIYDYLDQLRYEGSEYLGFVDIDGDRFYAFHDPSEKWSVAVGTVYIQGSDYIMVMIYPIQD